MKRHLGIMLRACAIIGLATVLSGAALAQQKTVKQCRDEWRANETTNKANGITESAYVKSCRAGTSAAQSATPAAAAPAAAPGVAPSGQKTAKQCRDEWRANEAANKANRITESAYVKSCRAGTATAQPATPRAATPAAAPAATPAGGKTRTVRECRDEWRANEAANKKAGITESAYVKTCRGGTTTATPTSAPTTAPASTQAPARAPAAPAAPSQAAAPTAPPPAPAPAAKPAPSAKPAPTASATPTGADQFANETQAKSHCPGDLVVWVNTDSHIYHFSGHDDYGTTKQGAYMCEKDATAAGNRAAKNEKHP
jgi:hypothetical protein